VKPVKKKGTGRTVELSASNPAASRKLLQLNLHRALAWNFRGHQVLHDLSHRRRLDCASLTSYVSEAVIRLNEALFGNCFHLNALSGGKNTDLFELLDSLKYRINEQLDVPCSGEQTRDIQLRQDVVSALLSTIIGESDESERPRQVDPRTGLPQRPSAREMLAHLSGLTLDAADRGLSATSEHRQGDRNRIVPVGYIDLPATAAETSDTPDNRKVSGGSADEAVQLLIDGLQEVAAAHGDGAESGSSPQPALRTIVLHSSNAVCLSADFHTCRGVMGAEVFDEVAGNHIYMLIASKDSRAKPEAVRQLLLRTLYWLDFDTVDSLRTISAGIGNLTREEMGDHLSMLGKLLSFAANSGDRLTDEKSIQNSMDYFLERIV